MNQVLMAGVGASLLWCVSLGTAVAGDGLFGPAPTPRGAGSAPVRTMFGLPMPQQWAGQRPGMWGAAGNAPVCRNGRCPVPQTTKRVPTVTNRDQGWSGAVTRSQPADPFRPSGRTRVDNESWFNRPVTAPLRDAFGSGYSSRELDLRRDYFSGGGEDDVRRERAPSSGRSMEVPVEREVGTTRI